MPTAVESIGALGAVLVQLPQAPASQADKGFEYGGRQGFEYGGRQGFEYGGFRSGAQGSDQILVGLLRPSLPQIEAVLQKTLPPNQRMVEIMGIGTTPGIIAILIGLLRSAGYLATIASCDGSVRPGFHGPTAILRAQGGTTPALFVQQVAWARRPGA